MTVSWNDDQRAKVDAMLAEHPLDSYRCADAARAVLPTARELDGASKARIVLPNLLGARWVLPREFSPRPYWAHHVTVAVTDHYVDGLTRSPGEPMSSYLGKHFHRPELHTVADVDLAREDL